MELVITRNCRSLHKYRFVSFFLSRSSPSRLACGASLPFFTVTARPRLALPPPASGAPSTLGPAATDERRPGLARPLHHRRVAPRPRSAPPPPASGGPPALGPAATGERRPGRACSLRHRRAAPRPRSAPLPLRTTSTCSLPTTASRSATRCSKRTKDGHAVPSVGSGELRCVGVHGRPRIWRWSC